MTLEAIFQERLDRMTEDDKAVAAEKLSTCDKCPNKKQLSACGAFIQNTDNLPQSSFFCGLCGCSIWGKVKNEDSTCPDNRWPQIGYY